jgi:hypothetical protein
MDLPRKDLDRIVVDLRCSSCPEGGRCDDCQQAVAAAVADTLAYFRGEYPDWTDSQITERFIHVKPA